MRRMWPSTHDTGDSQSNGCKRVCCKRNRLHGSHFDAISTIRLESSMDPLSLENAAAVASGIEIALKALHRSEEGKVVVIAGDGGTVDIGMQAISGMLERGHDICCICYDNEAYMNTGNQRSGSTPLDASTTTSPFGKRSFGNDRPKKNMPAIAAAHGIPYVATSSVGYPRDLAKKVQKGISVSGPAYLQIHAPCNIGWGFD